MNETDTIQALRAELTEPQPVSLPRPEISKTDQIQLAMLARKINAIRDEKMRLTYVAAFLAENSRLTAEVNTLRAQLGFETLPTYNPMMKGKHE